MVKKLAANILRGRKCVWCASYKLHRLADGRVKCSKCRKIYSIQKLRQDLDILHHFCLELSARKTANDVGLSYKTAYNKFMFFRRKIAEHSDKNFEKMSGELELDETYFGGVRKGKRGRGAYNKAIVFGILERDGKVYTKVVPDVSAKTLMSEIRSKTEKGSVFYTDCFKSYKSLKRFGKHLRINKQHTFASGRNHINGIESFWAFAKERFHKYHGINQVNYPLYLKELEFRFNHRNADIFKIMFNMIYR